MIILAAIIIVVKKKKIQSSVSAPPTQSILKKNTSEYTPTTIGFDNTGYTSETEERVCFIYLFNCLIVNYIICLFIFMMSPAVIKSQLILILF